MLFFRLIYFDGSQQMEFANKFYLKIDEFFYNQDTIDLKPCFTLSLHKILSCDEHINIRSICKSIYSNLNNSIPSLQFQIELKSNALKVSFNGESNLKIKTNRKSKPLVNNDLFLTNNCHCGSSTNAVLINSPSKDKNDSLQILYCSENIGKIKNQNLEIFYQFIGKNNMKILTKFQQLKSKSFICLFCHLNCKNLDSLLKHMSCNHFRLHIECIVSMNFKCFKKR